MNLEDLLITVVFFICCWDRWHCELSGDIVDGGQWYHRHAALADLLHFTRLDVDQQLAAAATLSDESQCDTAADGLDEISIS